MNTNSSGQLIVTGLAGTAAMYIDGVATTTAAASSALNTDWHHVVITTGSAFTVDNLTLGRVLTQYFGGSIDDFRLYTRVLSQNDITRLYHLGATTKTSVTLTTNPTFETGLVGHWTMDGKNIDLSLNTAEVRDRAPSPHHGNWLEHGSTTVPGVIGQAVDFDGTNDYISVGNAGSGIKSVAFWLKADVTTSRKLVNIDGTDQIELDASSVVTATSFPGTVVIYVDGVVASTIPNTGWHHVVVTDTTGVSATTLELGRVSTSYFDGVLDDVRIYSRVLPQSEVTRLYQMGK